MDFRLPLSPADSLVPRARGPVPVWIVVALVGLVLGLAVAAAGVVTDERSYAQQHGVVLRSQAL